MKAVLISRKETGKVMIKSFPEDNHKIGDKGVNC
jgi:hypothetical protein